MYKMFDGSAIMAIGQQNFLSFTNFLNISSFNFLDSKGMLVQEYIAEALDSQPPDEWETADDEERDETDIIDMECIQ